tara:strand:- start:511 stop:654 length:144 start_codon:yes stop_codon:yes gene_type:complete
MVGQGSVPNLLSRTPLDVEKQGNQAQKIKMSKINQAKILRKSSDWEA